MNQPTFNATQFTSHSPDSAALQIRSFPLPGKLPTVPRRLPVTSDLCSVQEGREVAGAAEEVAGVAARRPRTVYHTPDVMKSDHDGTEPQRHNQLVVPTVRTAQPSLGHLECRIDPNW